MKTQRPYLIPHPLLRILLAICVLAAGSCFPGLAQGTAFTYQGVLNQSGEPASGLYDFRAELFNRAIPGEPGDLLVSSTLNVSAVPVSNGVFVLKLDFGAVPFNGEARWLMLQVRTNNAVSYTVLLPRQSITPAPYAITAGNLSTPLSPATLPTGGNWALNSTLTFDTSTLAIDPVNNRVGFGITSPVWPFHLVASQGVILLDTTASTFGSVLELRSSVASPSYVGAINFVNSAGSYRGQIGYTGTDDLIFRAAASERMRLYSSGRLDVLGSSNRGVYAESILSSGIAVFGFAGPPRAVTPTGSPAGVVGESDWSSGNGVVGIANNGSSAYGVWGKSASGYGGRFEGATYGISAASANGTAVSGSSANGYAGNFAGAVRIDGNSSHGKPFLQIHEAEDGDFARIQLSVASRPLWHVSVGGSDNSLVFYNSSNSIVSAISEAGVLTTRVLTVTGGADLAEPFPMSSGNIAKGAVVIIDEDRPGQLALSERAYDTRVAGVVSGANGIKPGISLQQEGTLDGGQHVALSGRVYVKGDASNGAIKPGDLLTTSHTPGHAMKVTDHARAQGAILGKAMTILKEGRGLVLVLVTLQ